jgi:hypothetical protein
LTRNRYNSNIDNGTDPNDDYLSPKGVSRYLNMAIQGLQNIIRMATENYDRTGNLEALELASQSNVVLADAIKRVGRHYGHSYGNNFELTK